MTFIKVLKTSAYYSRYQVKYRRRRMGATNYHARRRMIRQDKDKYNTAKHRLVVRLTNKRVVVSIVYATLTGDKTVVSADSAELPRFGVKAGLTNYAACYCTGLLCARRHLKKLGLDTQFEGIEATGDEYHPEDHMEDRRPFKCYLDIGLKATTTGGRVFGAMKGAVDGGLSVPHNTKRFPGHHKEGGYDPAKHRDFILGKPVADFMTLLKESDPEKYRKQFSQYIKLGIEPEHLSCMYLDAHKKIRACPDLVQKHTKKMEVKREGNYILVGGVKIRRDKKLTNAQRKARVQEKLQIIAQKIAAEQ